MNENDFPDLSSEASIEVLDALLQDHADRAAERAVERLGGPLDAVNLPRFLEDDTCLRYATTVLFSAEGMEPHQFAEPYFEEDDGKRVCRLHVHPRFAGYPHYLPYFVAYMAPVINYGQVATPEVCERYGAYVLGLDQEAFYTQLCDIMDNTPF